jgi:hypothetical protein
MLVPLHRDYDSLSGYALRSFSRAFSVVNIPELLPALPFPPSGPPKNGLLADA